MEDPQNSRPSEYRAPTWSWASVDCEVLEVNSIAPFGRVKDGTLKVSAVMKEAIWDGTLIRRIRSRHERGISSYRFERTAGDIMALTRPDVTEETLYIENRDELNKSVPKEVVFHMVQDQERPNTVSRQVACLVLPPL